MPVSKKRKKDGKPARRAQPAPGAEGAEAEHATGPEVKGTALQQRVMGRPTNPFVAQMPKRAAQRGR